MADDTKHTHMQQHKTKPCKAPLSCFTSFAEHSGIVLYGYTPYREQACEAADKIAQAARRAIKIGFKRILILTPRDMDCGNSHPRIYTRIKRLEYARDVSLAVRRYEGPLGEVLNRGASEWEYLKFLYSHIFFVDAVSAGQSVTLQNFCKVFYAFKNGAKTVGLEPERDASYFSRGYLSEQFVSWERKSFVTAGGFDGLTEGLLNVSPTVRLIDAMERAECFAPFVAPIVRNRQRFQTPLHDEVAMLDSEIEHALRGCNPERVTPHLQRGSFIL